MERQGSDGGSGKRDVEGSKKIGRSFSGEYGAEEGIIRGYLRREHMLPPVESLPNLSIFRRSFGAGATHGQRFSYDTSSRFRRWSSGDERIAMVSCETQPASPCCQHWRPSSGTDSNFFSYNRLPFTVL